MAKTRQRNYRAEYARRIASAKVRGLSRSQARGHARPSEKAIKGTPRNIDTEIELIRKALACGVSLTSAAKAHGVSKERARRYIATHGIAKFEGGKWIVTDARPRQVPIASKGEQKVVVVSPEEASKAGSYANAAKFSLNTNDPEFLAPWRGKFVKDIRGKKHPLETDLNALHRIAAADDPSWPDIYKIVI